MFLWGSYCSRCAGHSGALGSTTLTAILSAGGHWEIESCEFVFVLVVVIIGLSITKRMCCHSSISIDHTFKLSLKVYVYTNV